MKTKKGDSPKAITKDVEFVAKDDDEQVATGIVMVPDKVDLQNDFIREDQLRAFAEQFENFESVNEAGGGVMHAVFPDEHLTLQRNEVLDEAETIGDATAPAGAWVQSWKYDSDELWSLVSDGILAGYSVGIDSVRWDGPYEQDADAVDDVEVPPEIDEDELVWQIVDGIMREVSTVDIPAVPDALIHDKAAAEKRLSDHLGNRDAFLDEAQQRGHSEDEAERLWEYLNDAVDVEGAGQPGKQSVFERIGKAVFEALPRAESNEAPPSETVEANDDGSTSAGQDDKDATGGETPDDDTTETDMSNDDTDTEAKELAEKNAEQLEELGDKVDEIADAVLAPEDKTHEIELDGETVEVTEAELRSLTGDDDPGADGASEVENEIKALRERIDALAEQSGIESGQIHAAAGGETNDDEQSELKGLGAALS